MATQHPDNAHKPFWHFQAFVSSSAEIKECYLCFSNLGFDEYNWDWEGKFVDEAVIDRLIHRYYSYFQKHPLGKDKFLTFRIPNPRVEKQFRLARSFMVIITSSQLAQSLGFDSPPVFETILPLTESAEEIIEIQKAYRNLVSVEHTLLKMDDSLKQIEIIPLFEQVSTIIRSSDIIRQYIHLYKKSFGVTPDYLRPYCARSDPALNSGLVPTMLALKVALSSYVDVEHDTGVRLFPLVGTGSLPFRGGVTPNTIDQSIEKYAGVATIIIQSGFRYDYPVSSVKSAILKLKQELPKRKAKRLSSHQVKSIHSAVPIFEKAYKHTIEYIAPLINTISQQVAKRRERMLHIGLFGYSRGVGNVQLPRAIPFTATLYSLGIPPELIGSGRGIREAEKMGCLDDIKACYAYMVSDLIEAGYFLNKENLKNLAKRHSFWYDIVEDIACIERVFGIELGPSKDSHVEHYKIAKKVYEHVTEKKELSQLITQGGIIRKSLG